MRATHNSRSHAGSPSSRSTDVSALDGGRSGPRKRRGNKAHTSLDTAAHAYRMLTTGPAPLSLDGAAAGAGLPRRLIPLSELREILLDRATSRAARDAAWRQVVDQAHAGSAAWVIGAVGLALPALRRMAGDLAEGYRGDVADLDAAILAAFVEALHRIDTRRPGIITRLRWAAYRAGLLTRYARQGVAMVSLPPPESTPPPYPWRHPDLLLADAVAKGVLSPVQAELIGRSRLENLTLKQAAAELGLGYEAARKARQRGEARLVAALARGDVENRLSPPAPSAGLRPAGAPRPGAGAQSRDRATAGREPAGVRGPSVRSDGTPDSDNPHPEGGAFCDPARRPLPSTEPSKPPGPSPARSRRRRPSRRPRRPHRPTGGTP